MLDDMFIKKIVDEAIDKYGTENGKRGMAKKDVIEIVMKYGGDMDDDAHGDGRRRMETVAEVCSMNA